MRRKLSVLAVIALTVVAVGATGVEGASAATSAETSAVNWAWAQVEQHRVPRRALGGPVLALRGGRVCGRGGSEHPHTVDSPSNRGVEQEH